MKECLTPDVLANMIRLIRSGGHKGTILAVEGDTDARVYKVFVDTERCKTFPCNGKDNVLGILKILEKEFFKGLIAITDADFQRLDGENTPFTNLLLTDTHDLESMILSCQELFSRILDEFGSTDEINKQKAPIIGIILDNAFDIGLLRWLNSPSQENLRIKFKGINFEDIIEDIIDDIIDEKQIKKKRLKISLERLFQVLKTRSPNTDIAETLKHQFENLKRRNLALDPWQVCNGHDMVEFLALGFRKCFGNKKESFRNMTVESLEKTVRLTYCAAYFQQTQLYRHLREWEESNAPFRVFKE